MNGTNEYILALIAARLCGEKLSGEEDEKLDQWITAKPENRKLYDYYDALFHRKDELKIWEEVQADARIRDRIFQARSGKKSFMRKYLKYAAIIIPFSILAGWSMYYHAESGKQVPTEQIFVRNDIAPGKQKARLEFGNGEIVSLSDSSMAISSHQDIQVGKGGILQYASGLKVPEAKAVYHTLVVDRGAEFQLVLPDGTKVWLNSESELRYPNLFNEDKRKVFLKGEAYFEVKHSVHQPFIVMAGECAIRVLGTEFNVSSYSEKNQVVTTLVNGKVAYTAGKQNGELIPGEQCIYNTEKRTSLVRKVDVGQYISWKDGLFVFDHIRMEDLAVQIARWYDVEVVFPDYAARYVSFTGAMERYKPVSYIIDLLNGTNTVECRLEGNKLEFRQK